MQTLRLFSQQSGVQILYPPDEVRGRRTNPVRGRFAAREALEILLERTGLVAVHDPHSGAVFIKRETLPRGARSPLHRLFRLPRDSRREAAALAKELDRVVILTPFEVRSRTDLGYRATNSVSATRMALPIRELPMNVMAFTESFINDQKPYDLYDVVKWAPGVHQDNASPQGWVRYNIRGFTSVAVQRNGSTSFRFIDTTNVDRVEVVKGPASLLYGQINPGGVINYITKRPERRKRMQFTGSVGDHGYNRIVLDATGAVPHTDDKLLYRAIGMTENIQRFQQFSRGRKHLFAPSVTWKLSERTALTIDYEHFERLERMITGGVVLNYRDVIPHEPYAGLPWDFSYAGEGDYQDFIADAFTAELTTALGEHVDLRASYVDSYWDMEWRASGQGGTGLIAQSVIDAYYPPGAGLTPAHAMYRRNRWEHQWGGERMAQLDAVTRFEFAGFKIDALVGVRRIFDSRYRGLQRNNPNVAGHPLYLQPWDLRNPATWNRAVPFGVDALVPTVDTRSSSSSSSVAGVVSASTRGERLRLLAGYAHHRVKNDPTYNYLNGTSAPASVRAADVPQFGGMVKLVEGLSAFLSYSESFRANTSLLRVDNVPSVPAAPSIGRAWETGFKLDLADGRVSGTLSAYRIRARPTGIVTVTTGLDQQGTTLFSDVQGGSQLSEGFEFDLLVSPDERIQLGAAFSRCDAVYERHPGDRAFDGTPLAATPEMTFSVWGKYRFRTGRLAGFTLSGGLNRVGSMSYVGNNPSARFPSYTTADVTLGYRFRALGRKWLVDISVKNLTDERYYVSSTSWGFPRHAIASLSTRF